MSSSKTENRYLTDSFFRKALWNLVAEAAPFIFAIVSVPLLITLIGKERFGLLSIIWILIGYFNLFDLGLARSIAHFAARMIGEGKRDEAAAFFWSGLSLMLVLALTASVFFYSKADLLVDYLNTGAGLRAEARQAVLLLGIAVPFVMAATAFKGLLQADQRYRTISLIQVPFGAWIFLAPVVMAWAGYDTVDMLTLALVAGRIVLLIAFGIAAHGSLKTIFRPSGSLEKLKSMLSYSGWIAVSNIVGPLMVYFDRLIVSSLLGLVAVANYVVPFDLVYRTGVIPASIATVLFTATSFNRGENNKKASPILFNQALNLILTLTAPLYLFTALFSHEILSLWVGPDQASESASVMTIISLALLINAATRVPHAVLQGAGRANTTAFAHLLELPLYAAALYFAALHYGIEGAACVWLGRCLIDLVLLSLFCFVTGESEARPLLKAVLLTLSIVCAIFVLNQFTSTTVRMVLAAPVFAASAFIAIKLLKAGFSPNYSSSNKGGLQ